MQADDLRQRNLVEVGVMRKPALCVVLALVLLLAGCASSVPDAPAEPAKKQAQTMAEILADFEAAGRQMFSDNFEITQDGKWVNFTAWNPEANSGFRKAIAGDAEYRKTWIDMVKSFEKLSGSMHDRFVQNGYDDITSMVSIVDCDVHEDALYMAVDGATIYDAVRGIDTEGVNAEAARIVSEHFKDVAPTAALESKGTYGNVDIRLLTGWSADECPADWDQICAAAVDASKNAINAVYDVHAFIIAENGDILATFAGGRQTYDLYAKAEKQDDGELPPGVTVVSNGVVSQGSIDLENATLGEKNAYKKALQYLDLTAFSYDGLIEQLEYEKFSHAEAVFAADHCGADWYEQAAKKAESYLSISSFSRDRLIDQLVYEGFSRGQAEYGVSKVGY